MKLICKLLGHTPIHISHKILGKTTDNYFICFRCNKRLYQTDKELKKFLSKKGNEKIKI